MRPSMMTAGLCGAGNVVCFLHVKNVEFVSGFSDSRHQLYGVMTQAAASAENFNLHDDLTPIEHLQGV